MIDERRHPWPLLPRQLQPRPVRDAVVEPPTSPRPRWLKALGRVTPSVRYPGPVRGLRDRWSRRLEGEAGWLLEGPDHLAFVPVAGVPTVLARTAVRHCRGEGQLARLAQTLTGDTGAAVVFELHNDDHLDVWLTTSRAVRLRVDAWPPPQDGPSGALGPTRHAAVVTPDDLSAASRDAEGLALWAALAARTGVDPQLVAMARGLARR